MRSLSRLTVVLWLSAAAPLLLRAQSPVPPEYQDLYPLLNNYLTAFNTTLGSPAPYPTLYTASLLNADANDGPQIENPGYWPSVVLQIQELKAMGIQGITVQVGFPMLYAPFFTDPSEYQSCVNFYTQVAAAVRQAGLKLIVENDSILNGSNAGVAWNSAAFYATLNWDQYQQARAQTAAMVAQVMQPDYLVVLQEPDTEAAASGQTQVQSPTGAAQMLSQEIAAVQAAAIPNMLIGAGVGTWLYECQNYISAFVALPLNFIDIHIYPINLTNLPNALSMIGIAAAAGLPVTMTECWLHKVRDNEPATLTEDEIRARNVFDFWEPLDITFTQTMENLANYAQMPFVNFFASTFYFAYLPYNSTTSTAQPDDLLTEEIQQASQSNEQAVYSSVGMAFYNSLVTTPDTIPPAAPANVWGSSANPNGAYIVWPIPTDNVGVAGYYVFRNGVQIATVGHHFYVDSGLTEAVTYSYMIEAFDLAGNISPPSQTIQVTTEDVTPPTPPTNLVGTPLSCQKLSLTWTPSSDNAGIANYIVFFGTDPGGLTQIGTPKNPIYTIPQLNPQTTYYYAVEAVDPSGNTSAMSTILAVSTPALPAAPGSLAASSVSASQISLTWAASTGAFPINKYYVFRGIASSGLAQIGTVNGTTFTDSSLSPTTTYYYAIQAIDTSGDLSPLSGLASTTTYTPPQPPAVLTASALTSSQNLLSWPAGKASLPIVQYYVFRGTSPATLTQVALRTVTLQYTDSGLAPSTTYYYGIEAVDSAGDISPMSALVTATTYALPTSPGTVAVTPNSSSQMALTWSAATGPFPIAKYYIFKGTSSSTLTRVAKRTTNLLYTDNSLPPGATCYYAVEAVDSTGSISPMSTVVWATSYTLPTAPTGLTATTISSMQINLAWGGSTGQLPVTSYKIYRDSSLAGLTADIAKQNWWSHVNGNKTTFGDNPLSGATTYYYAIQAADSAGDLSPASPVATAVTYPLPTAPALTATVNSSTQVSLAWQASTGTLPITSYQIFRGLSPNAMAQVGMRTSTLTYTDNTAQPATAYYYGVQSTDTQGDISPMTVVTATTYALPSTPVASATTVSSTKIVVTWTASSGVFPVAGYQILRGTAPNALTQVGNRTSLTFADTTVLPGTTYYYGVAAVDTDGNVSKVSPISASTYSLPSTPAVTATVLTSVKVAVTWTASTGAVPVTNYVVWRGLSPTSLSQVATRTTTLTYTDSSLSPATTYYYGIQAVDAAGDVSQMNVVPVTTLSQVSTPGSLTATTLAGEKITLGWTGSSGPFPLKNYRIYRDTSLAALANDVAALNWWTTAPPTKTSYTDSGLTPGTTYYYAVQATDTSGSASLASAPASATTYLLPSAPVVTATVDSGEKVVLTWAPSNSGSFPITSYRVLWGTSPGSLSLVTVKANTLSYTSNTLTPGTTYYYCIEALDSGGNTSPLNPTPVTTDPLPTAPANLTATATSATKASLTWTASTSSVPLTAYKIYRATSAANLAADIAQQNWWVSILPTKSFYNDSGMTASTTYYYAIQALDSVGDYSPSSAVVTVTTLP